MPLAIFVLGFGAGAGPAMAAADPVPTAGAKPDAGPDVGVARTGAIPPRDWKTPFLAAYRLAEGSALKHIPTPFLPERVDFHRDRVGRNLVNNPKPPDWMCFRQSGSELRAVAFGLDCDEKNNLGDVLRHAIRLGYAEFDGPDELLKLPIRGDWTIKEGAPPDVLLPELAAILQKETGRRLVFEQRSVSRETIVVRSGAKTSLKTGDEIHLYAEDASDTGMYLHRSAFSSFLTTLGDRLRLATVNETTEAPERLMWRDHKDANLNRAGDRRDELTRKILANLSDQSGMTFTLESRPVKVWFVTELR